MAVLNNSKMVYLNHSVLNIVMTKDPVFTEYIYQHLQNIMRKSTLMSLMRRKGKNKIFQFPAGKS